MGNIGSDLETCGGLLPIVKVIRKGLFPVIQIVIPIVLIILGTIDLGKAVISSEEKEIKAAQKLLIKRFIYAAAIFFVALFVNIVMGWVAKGGLGGTSEWKECWTAAGN